MTPGPSATTSPSVSVLPASAPVTLTHVHGLSYGAEEKQLLIPSHHGLAVYAAGRGFKAEGRPAFRQYGEWRWNARRKFEGRQG